MFKKKSFFSLLLLNCFLYSSVPLVIENEAILSYVDRELPHEGILKQGKNGLLYIELPKEYVYEILPLLGQCNACPPPYFGEGSVGAHITVARAKEMQNVQLDTVPYLGEIVPFTVINCAQVQLEKNSTLGSYVYLLTIESPAIAEIRSRLGLAPTINGDDFHITVAVNCN